MNSKRASLVRHKFFNEYFDFGNRSRDQEINHEIEKYLKWSWSISY